MLDYSALHNSKTPKYRQIVHQIEQLVRKGKLKIGDRLPSINEVSENYLVARDTVEKAYGRLKEDNTITSVKGKGYFVANTNIEAKLQVCLLFNKLSPYKKILFDNLVSLLGNEAVIDLFIHHCDIDLFENLVRKTKGQYSYYIVMPHFDKINNRVVDALDSIPDGQLIFLDREVESITHKNYGTVYQSFEQDIMEVIDSQLTQIKEYEEIVLVFPTDKAYPYPNEIVKGFSRGCAVNNLNYRVINGIDSDTMVERGKLYLLISETDLANLIKRMQNLGIKIGKEIGVLSYNDTPLKEVLANGISVISTDFKYMAATTAAMIVNNKLQRVRNPFRFIDRGSMMI